MPMTDHDMRAWCYDDVPAGRNVRHQLTVVASLEREAMLRLNDGVHYRASWNHHEEFAGWLHAIRTWRRVNLDEMQDWIESKQSGSREPSPGSSIYSSSSSSASLRITEAYKSELVLMSPRPVLTTE
ncbi:hypothetical protein AXG93_4346s1180 [Marchantia polymorpha subsp. ruderalis]|uniref:Uncharacterized protein n=1 Tax=Marchantia polymorpha subsp. ruderalis TaxID=1480154 RepID=A0A176WTJ9_MARPO|nr:hypothetical protein AXG93_4346s1180 [Marchantia polymorpha subsp. ruderalis]